MGKRYDEVRETIYRVRKKVNRVLCYLLVVALLLPALSGLQNPSSLVEVYAEELSGADKNITDNVINEIATTDIVSETTTVSQEVPTKASETTEATETTGNEDVSTEAGITEETTTELETTDIETTTEPATEVPTTEAPTTVPQDIKVKPWGKNKYGQFVNGKKKIIQGATMKGIDVSHHQGKIDWKKVSESDVDYAIIRCGYGDNLKKQDDKYWDENVAGCEKYNIPYGVYIYSYATTTAQAKSEAEHVLRLIKGHTLNFPIYYDMEDPIQERLSNTKRKEIATTFLNEIHNAGYECGVYANLNWWNNYIPESIFDNTLWYKWVAQYNDNGCAYDGVYQMWQCTSEGTVPGVYGDVDINFWFGEVRDRNYNIKRNITVAPSKPKPVKVTEPKRVTIKSLKKGKKKATLKWKKVSGAKGYRIQYSTSKKFKKSKTKVKTTTKTKIVIKKLKSKKKYYFRVKAYKLTSSKKKLYSKKWSKVKSVKIK